MQMVWFEQLNSIFMQKDPFITLISYGLVGTFVGIIMGFVFGLFVFLLMNLVAGPQMDMPIEMTAFLGMGFGAIISAVFSGIVALKSIKPKK